jgi:hypothetical protein
MVLRRGCLLYGAKPGMSQKLLVREKKSSERRARKELADFEYKLNAIVE